MGDSAICHSISLSKGDPGILTLKAKLLQWICCQKYVNIYECSKGLVALGLQIYEEKIFLSVKSCRKSFRSFMPGFFLFYGSCKWLVWRKLFLGFQMQICTLNHCRFEVLCFLTVPDNRLRYTVNTFIFIVCFIWSIYKDGSVSAE